MLVGKITLHNEENVVRNIIKLAQCYMLHIELVLTLVYGSSECPMMTHWQSEQENKTAIYITISAHIQYL
jgi:hypothetical protein